MRRKKGPRPPVISHLSFCTLCKLLSQTCTRREHLLRRSIHLSIRSPRASQLMSTSARRGSTMPAPAGRRASTKPVAPTDSGSGGARRKSVATSKKVPRRLRVSRDADWKVEEKWAPPRQLTEVELATARKLFFDVSASRKKDTEPNEPLFNALCTFTLFAAIVPTAARPRRLRLDQRGGARRDDARPRPEPFRGGAPGAHRFGRRGREGRPDPAARVY